MNKSINKAFKISYTNINELLFFPYKYMVVCGPIDNWEGCFFPFEEYTFNISVIDGDADKTFTMESFQRTTDKDIADYRDKVDKAVQLIESIEAEKPHTIGFIHVPNFEYYCMDEVMMCKISNNGTTFVFSNNLSFMKSLIRE